MALKVYTLEIVYDTDSDEIEYIKEYVSSATDSPALIPMVTEIEIPEGYWETGEEAES
ncbi:MAG: hypothetical protein Unbinned4409contig1002_56 [Prokaryotic dsDNA virus sp.]|nr:MAG: hypothetical protein Unbinned4409contig1002_56 [Prokaryotic dsDNA virus sp.]|tara:strand:+ start:1106 stop:1279 length:174 start_codon:yes stop_codon:yes gene_type:complete